MSIENKTNHAVWSASFYDETTYPSWWKKNWGIPIELWLIESAGHVRLYITKERIIHKVNEDMRGRLPIYHVWNLRTDRHVFCGQNQQEAYTVYQQEIEKERCHDRN